MTSVSLYGAYEQTEDEFAAPKFGHPKDRRPDRKQVQAGLAVTADGGVPVFHRAYDGGAAEGSQVVGAMTALQNLATPPGFLLVGDSKLVSYTNLSAMSEAGVTFLAPASETYVRRPRSWPPSTLPRPPRSTTSPDATRTHHQTSAAGGGYSRTP